MRWLLPEHVEDVLPAEAAKIEALRRALLDLFASRAYELVMPPLLEYLDSLLTGTGHDLDLRTFKLVDQLFIPQVHEQVEQGLRRRGRIDGRIDALGIVETTTVASAILAADAALKTATVDLLELRIANGLGGKSFFTLTGEVSDVRSSVAAGAELAQERGLLAREVVIPRPHAELVRHL